MNLARRSGVFHVNIGIESIGQSTLSGMNKIVNQVKQYKEILPNLRKRGISYSLNFIFGWDTETVGVFGSTLEFLKEEKVPVAYFNILTPHRILSLPLDVFTPPSTCHPEKHCFLDPELI